MRLLETIFFEELAISTAEYFQKSFDMLCALIIRIICKRIFLIYVYLGSMLISLKFFIVCLPFSDASRNFLMLRILNKMSEILDMNKIYYFTDKLL